MRSNKLTATKNKGGIFCKKNHASNPRNAIERSNRRVHAIPCFRFIEKAEKNDLNIYESRPSNTAKLNEYKAALEAPIVITGRLQMNQSKPAKANE